MRFLYPNDELHLFNVVTRPFGFADAYVFSDMRLTVPPGKYAVNVALRHEAWGGALLRVR
jgi:hypothetical protein